MAEVHTSTQDSATTPALREMEPNTNETCVGNSTGVDNEENDNLYAPKRRKRTSKAWANFKEVTLPDGTTKAECIHCKHKLAVNKSGVTSHFLRHLNGCTRKKLSDERQQTISVTTKLGESETVSVIQNFRYDHSRIREVFSHMIMVHELPFCLAEYELFNLLMKTASPYYQKISRTTVKNDVVTSYNLEKKVVHAVLKDVEKVSITTDIWKSDQNKSYMVVTCHYVDANWNLQKRNLNFLEVPPPHNGVSTCDMLKKSLMEWEIGNKVWTVTVDNAAYNDAAVRMLKDDLSYTRNIPLGGALFHVRCCAHILNLLVQDGLAEIQDIIHNVRESVKYISASEARVNTFSEIAKQLNLSSKKLILDCCTRWNATYYMLSAALEFKDVFSRYQQRDSGYYYLPSSEDWRKVSKVCTFLEEFNEVTHLISGSEYPTSNLFLPEMYNIKRMLNEVDVGDESFMAEMRNKMKVKFDKYWGKSNLLISIAAVLDPRNKMKLVEWCFPMIYSDEANEHIVKVRDTLYKLYKEYVEAYKASVAAQDTPSRTQNFGLSNVNTVKGKGKVRAEFSSYMRTVDPIEQVKSELDVYLEESVLVCDIEDQNFDALTWWKLNSLKYRILSKMASDVLSIPITTVASESTFSAGGRVIDESRTSLGTETVQILLCGEDWFRARYGIKRKSKEKKIMKEILLT